MAESGILLDKYQIESLIRINKERIGKYHEAIEELERQIDSLKGLLKTGKHIKPILSNSVLDASPKSRKMLYKWRNEIRTFFLANDNIHADAITIANAIFLRDNIEDIDLRRFISYNTSVTLASMNKAGIVERVTKNGSKTDFKYRLKKEAIAS